MKNSKFEQELLDIGFKKVANLDCKNLYEINVLTEDVVLLVDSMGFVWIEYRGNEPQSIGVGYKPLEDIEILIKIL